jgi:hypothetical protein
VRQVVAVVYASAKLVITVSLQHEVGFAGGETHDDLKAKNQVTRPLPMLSELLMVVCEADELICCGDGAAVELFSSGDDGGLLKDAPLIA